MKEALFYKKIKKGNNTVQCFLCPRLCKMDEGRIGYCNVRQNKKGKLYSLVYGKAASVQIDPVEKKPLFHFLPGTRVFSFGTVGCNLRCKHCQNWQTSQTHPGDFSEQELEPEEIVGLAEENNCEIIASTYNEPTVFYEYMLDTAKIARKKGIKNIIVSNGFISDEPMRKLARWIDGANIDLKGFTNKFYTKTTTAWMQPVLDTLRLLKKTNVWLEITNLIIPTLNDEKKQIEEMIVWIKDNLGMGVPLHFSAFRPDYQLMHLPNTPQETLEMAFDVAKKHDLKYVYVGNIRTKNKENTYCPKCSKLLIKRLGFEILQNNLANGKCPECAEKIKGIWS